MLGLISVRPRNLFRYLVADECSLLKQAEKGVQSDGWGIAFYNSEPVIYKSTRPVYLERDAFSSLAIKKARIIIAHVRKASNPLKVSREELIALENTQPFRHGRYVFAHNGTIYYPREAIAYLGEYRSLLKGINDSEVYFLLLLKELSETGDFLNALRNVIRIFHEIHAERGGGVDIPYTSLNCIFTDGHYLYAATHYLGGPRLKTICLGNEPYYDMTYLSDGESLIVASERTNRRGPWRKIRNGYVIAATVEEGELSFKVLRLV